MGYQQTPNRKKGLDFTPPPNVASFPVKWESVMSIQSIFLQLTTASPLLQELKMCLPNVGGGKVRCERAREPGKPERKG